MSERKRDNDARNERVGATRARITAMTEIPPLLPGELNQLRIVHPLMRKPALLEAFQELEQQLMQRADGRNYIAAVTAVTPRGGASFVSLNLATTIALDHHRTALLVQCGPDDQTIDRLLMLPPDHGLTEYLADPKLDIESIIFSSRIPRLRVIPFGSSAAETRLLHSAAMQHLLHTAKHRYSDRFVIVDVPHGTPPETWRRLSQWCDFVVPVVPYGEASLSQVGTAVEAIGREKVAGLVINRDPAPHTRRG